MPGAINRSALLLLLLGLLAGCATSNTRGHRLEELQTPIKKLSYVVVPAKVDATADRAERFHDALHDLLILLPQRMPLVFSLNGIETGRNSDTQFELVIRPKSATYYRYTGKWFIVNFFSAYIIDKSESSKRVWEGELNFLNSEMTPINAQSIDNFAKEILQQLESDGMVKLEAREIKVPASEKL